jgi:hypothetical protein
MAAWPFALDPCAFGEDEMTQEEAFVDPARIERPERRLQVREDARAIRSPKARYGALCDQRYGTDGTAALFAEDAPWASLGLGRFEGREAIRRFFRGASEVSSFAIHNRLNGQLEANRDRARARWDLFMPRTVAFGDRARWRASIGDETYAGVDGTWMLRHKRSEPLITAPGETGWAQTSFA